MSTSPKCGPLDISHAAAVAVLFLVFYFILFFTAAAAAAVTGRTHFQCISISCSRTAAPL